MLTLLAAAFVLWATGFVILARLRRSCSSKISPNSATSGGPDPSRATLSVIIPARNEAHNLPRLLESLQTQSLRPAEVIVVDDGSSDGTPEVARSFGALVVTSEPLPGGWRGKTWACHQGARRAKHSLLLFLDADTWLAPGGLGSILSAYAASGAGAFSLAPYHAVQKLYEHLSLFFNLNMIVGTLPGRLFGQMLLIDSESYRTAGGHEAVKGRILENFWLAKKLTERGAEQTSGSAQRPVVRSANGRGVISFRMYPNGTKELIAGWIKGFASGAGQTPPGSLVLLIAWMTGLILAPLGLALSDGDIVWVVLYTACTLQVMLVSRQVGAFRWYTAPLYPVQLVFFFIIFALSAARSGKTVQWKGREIRAD